MKHFSALSDVVFPPVPPGAGVALVGGAVRDMLLGRPAKDRDFVVWGCSPEEFRRVNPRARLVGSGQEGHSIPVFLLDGCEVAMARTEHKTGPGHRGFAFRTGPEVTLKEDLARRDFTMNAMALLPSGELMDYFGGRDDLSIGVLRHISDAFSEDPLRVFRLARFAATLGFVPAFATVSIARAMHHTLNTIPTERIVNELVKGLNGEHVANFFLVLNSVGALDMLHPKILTPASLETDVECFASACRCLSPEEVTEMDGRLTLPVKLRQGAIQAAVFRRVMNSPRRTEECVKAIVAGARGPLGLNGLARACSAELLLPKMRAVVGVRPNLSLQGAAIGADVLRRQIEIWS